MAVATGEEQKIWIADLGKGEVTANLGGETAPWWESIWDKLWKSCQLHLLVSSAQKAFPCLLVSLPWFSSRDNLSSIFQAVWLGEVDPILHDLHVAQTWLLPWRYMTQYSGKAVFNFKAAELGATKFTTWRELESKLKPTQRKEEVRDEKRKKWRGAEREQKRKRQRG